MIKANEKDFLPTYDNPGYTSDVELLSYKLVDQDEVVVVKVGNVGLVFPIKVIEKYQVIPVSKNKMRYTLTYCPLADSAILFNGEWGVSGYQHKGNLVLYDKKNPDELVPHILGNSKVKRRGVIRTSWKRLSMTGLFEKLLIIVGEDTINYEEVIDKKRDDKFVIATLKSFDFKGYFLNDMERIMANSYIKYDEFVGIYEVEGTPFVRCYAFAWELLFPKQLKQPTINSIGWHPKDSQIKFDDSDDIDLRKRHDYYYKGIKTKNFGWKSVTQIKSLYFPFNAPMIAAKVSKTRNRSSKYFGKSTHEILFEWDLTRQLGTEFHSIVHDNLNYGKQYDDTKFIEEYKQFINYNDYMASRGYFPYRSEWYVFDEKHSIVGTIDIVFYSQKEKKYIIADFKRSSKSVLPNKKMIAKKSKSLQIIGSVSEVMKKLPKNDKHVQFSFQLGMYREILKSYQNIDFDFVCDEMHIVRFYPGLDNFQLGLVDPNFLDYRIQKLFMLMHTL